MTTTSSAVDPLQLRAVATLLEKVVAFVLAIPDLNTAAAA